jgi:uncharacterized protein (DUF697 family)
VPVPTADALGVLGVNIGMIASVSAIMGVHLSMDNIKTIAGSILAAMAATGGGRMIAGEFLKFIPGIGSVAGGLITSTIALSATGTLGYAYTEFLCRFHGAQMRMPDGEEIKDGFRKFWENWGDKYLPTPKP